MTTETVERRILVELRFPAALELLNAAIERRERLASPYERRVDPSGLSRIVEGEQALRDALAIPAESGEE